MELRLRIIDRHEFGDTIVDVCFSKVVGFDLVVPGSTNLPINFIKVI